MTKPIVSYNDSFDQWRIKTNQISNNIGDPQALSTPIKSSIVEALNDVNASVQSIINEGMGSVVDTLEVTTALTAADAFITNAIIGSISKVVVGAGNVNDLSITSSSDLDTGLFFPSANSLSVVVGGESSVVFTEAKGTQMLGVASKHINATNHNISATLTISDITGGIIIGNPTSSISLEVPTGTNCDSSALSLVANQSFEWSVINLAPAVRTITITANTNHTLVGNMIIAPATSGRFISQKISSNVFVTYRIA